MAKRKSAGLSPVTSGSDRSSADICEAENGFIVNVSGESGGKKPTYFSKRFVAGTRSEAMRIAATHFVGAMKGTKKSGRKKATAKR
jgi:hypothetical protein